MRLSVAVQHHPSRAELLPPLLAALEPLPVDVVSDPEPEGRPDTWRTYRAALEATPEWATHRVILQDDARPCRRFPETLERAVASQPEGLLVLCVCGLARAAAHDVTRAAYYGHPWTRLIRRTFVQTIGLVWPAAVTRAGLEWVDAQGWPRMFTADDEIVGRIAEGLSLDVLATVPSLVQHDDLVPSLTGRPVGLGRNPQRQAVLFEDEPAGVDWTAVPWMPF